MKILLELSYVGTAYCGWQVQKNGVSVQEVLQNAIETVFGKRYPVTGCSRTDSGVHARHFCCTAELDESAPLIPADRIPIALNTRLPMDVAVKRAEYVPDDFHARYSVKSKRYEYTIDNSATRDPFLSYRAWNVSGELDVSKMDAAAKEFIGTHDFSAFRAVGSSVSTTVRTVFDASVRRDGGLVVFSVSADGFLYNMVRIMVGTLVGISKGSVHMSVKEIILSKNRASAGMTAPPDGLCLVDVCY